MLGLFYRLIGSNDVRAAIYQAVERWKLDYQAQILVSMRIRIVRPCLQAWPYVRHDSCHALHNPARSVLVGGR